MDLSLCWYLALFSYMVSFPSPGQEQLQVHVTLPEIPLIIKKGWFSLRCDHFTQSLCFLSPECSNRCNQLASHGQDSRAGRAHSQEQIKCRSPQGTVWLRPVTECLAPSSLFTLKEIIPLKIPGKASLGEGTMQLWTVIVYNSVTLALPAAAAG